MSEFKQAIEAHSHVTLHYRLAVLDVNGQEERDFLNTFNGNPATVAVGQA